MNILLSSLAQGSDGNVIDRLQGYIESEENGTIAAQQLADPDYWSSVGIITIAGILIVFLILAILIIFFYALGAIFKAVDKSKAEKKAVEVKAVVPAPVPTVEIDEAEDDVDDDEIIAVISAAISAYEAEEGTSYTIKSIRRKGDRRTRSAWSMAGINANMRQF